MRRLSFEAVTADDGAEDEVAARAQSLASILAYSNNHGNVEAQFRRAVMQVAKLFIWSHSSAKSAPPAALPRWLVSSTSCSIGNTMSVITADMQLPM